MKLPGISQAQDRRKMIPDPFVKNPVERKTPLIWGKTFDGEEEIHRLWDSGEIDHYRDAEREKISHKLDMESRMRASEPDPLAGLTDREKRTLAFGYTSAQDLNADARRATKGYTQPTSKGQKVLESNVTQLRKKFGIT